LQNIRKHHEKGDAVMATKTKRTVGAANRTTKKPVKQRRTTKNVIDTLLSKRVWVSNGAALHSEEATERLAFSPKTGMTLQVRAEDGKRVHASNGDPELVIKYSKTRGGQYPGKPVTTKGRVARWVYFAVNQDIKAPGRPGGVVPAVDPATGGPVVVFPQSFKEKFEETAFVELAPGLLVSKPICLGPADVVPGGDLSRHLPLAITFTIEVYENKRVDKNKYLLVTAYWSDTYTGRYCYE
jgi:hypothetical protein